MTTTTALRITRTPLPPAIVPDDETMWGRHDTYAEVTSGSITAEVLRFAFWEDGALAEVGYEVRIDGMPDNQGGTCELYATEPSPLLDLAAVCGAAAMLLDEARQVSDFGQVQHA
jgi:hypothetical protein